MSRVFDGKGVAKRIEVKLSEKTKQLIDKGITPNLVSIMVGDNPASRLYLTIKKAAAEGIGAVLVIKQLDDSVSVNKLIELIKDLNLRKEVHGIMIQLPLPEKFGKQEAEQVVAAIIPEKDVDGMRKDSDFNTPVVKAALIAFREAISKIINEESLKIAVVGKGGFVGDKLINAFSEMGYQVAGLGKRTKNLKKHTKKADVVISATGIPGLIKKDMVKEGVMVIDIGSPKGDVDFEKVKKKASFVTPVPGGIGPLTVACLMENLVEAASG